MPSEGFFQIQDKLGLPYWCKICSTIFALSWKLQNLNKRLPLVLLFCGGDLAVELLEMKRKQLTLSCSVILFKQESAPNRYSSVQPQLQQTLSIRRKAPHLLKVQDIFYRIVWRQPKHLGWVTNSNQTVSTKRKNSHNRSFPPFLHWYSK